MYYVYFVSMQHLHLISDIDECEENFHNCDPVTQICVNTQGSFECQKQRRTPAQASCPLGFQLDSHSQTCVGECWISVTEMYICTRHLRQNSQCLLPSYIEFH